MDVTGIANACGFEDESSSLFVRDRSMLDTTRYDHELTGRNIYGSVPELHAKSTRKTQKEFICVLVSMPDKLACELHKL